MLKKEHLLNYMLRGFVHLSKKDYGFFNNLTFIIKDRQQITTNQNRLFDKLIVKYQRQLRKLKYELADLQLLEWDVPVIPTLDEYLTAKIYLEDDKLNLRTPYNTKFITEFRDQNDQTFEWDKTDRVYKSDFYTHSLRMAVELCVKHFGTVEFCDQIRSLIEPLMVYQGRSMAPTLVCENGTYTVQNSNKILDEILKDIELNADPQTLYRLSVHGVNVSTDITAGDPLKIFASEYLVQLDIDDLLANIEYFRRLNITDVCFYERVLSRTRPTIDKQIVRFFEDNGIRLHRSTEAIPEGAVSVVQKGTLGFRVTAWISHKKLNKVIHIVNSRPIDIK